MTATRRAAGAIVAVLTSALLLPGCGVIDRGGDGYRLTAYFDAAVALYPHGDVTVMGLDVGTVDEVVLEDTHVRVEMTIDAHVPLPADVQATIQPLQLIGERRVVLYPAWDQAMADAGAARIGDGDSIPTERTHVPVEPDDGLAALNDLASGIDPDTLGTFASDAAQALDGQGTTINQALGDAAALSDTLASVDDQLVGAAASLQELAGLLASRDEQLSTVVEAFSSATDVLASERDAIVEFLGALNVLTDQGVELLDLYGEQIPTDLANAAAFASVLHENVGSLEEIVAALPRISEGLATSYDPALGGLILRAAPSLTMMSLGGVLGDLVDVLLSDPGAAP